MPLGGEQPPEYPHGGGPQPPDDERAERNRGIAIGLAVAAALAVIGGALWAVTAGGGDDPVVVSPSPSGSASASETASPTDSPSPSDSPTQTPSPTEGEREPTDADAAEFQQSYRPEGAQAVDSVAADVDDDGVNEVVFASIHSDAARIDIARWTGTEYEVVYTGRGGGAERLEDFKVADYTGDGTREVVTVQSVGAQGGSLSIWGWNGQAFAPQRASGGCWHGSHTFGVIGASIQPGRIRASCDGSPLPTAAWPSDVYVWRDGWVYDHTEE